MSIENFLNQRELIEHDAGLLNASFRAIVLPAAICMAGMTLFWSLPAKAQSFSCASAETAAQFAICNDEGLQAMDEKLGTIYATAYVNTSTMPERQAVTRAHSEWLKKRNACRTDFTCLSLRYEERIKALSTRSS